MGPSENKTTTGHVGSFRAHCIYWQAGVLAWILIGAALVNLEDLMHLSIMIARTTPAIHLPAPNKDQIRFNVLWAGVYGWG